MAVPKKQDLLLVSLPENLLRKFPKTAFVGRGGQFLPLVTFSLRLLILLRCQVHLRFSYYLSDRLHPDLWFFTANRRCSPNVRMSPFHIVKNKHAHISSLPLIRTCSAWAKMSAIIW